MLLYTWLLFQGRTPAPTPQVVITNNVPAVSIPWDTLETLLSIGVILTTLFVGRRIAHNAREAKASAARVEASVVSPTDSGERLWTAVEEIRESQGRAEQRVNSIDQRMNTADGERSFLVRTVGSMDLRLRKVEREVQAVVGHRGASVEES